MVPIVNKPIMQHNLELLRKYGVRSVTANIHYHPEQIVNYFLAGEEFGVDLSYSYEETLMGTAGGVLRMGRDINKIDETFLVLSSDALTDINISKLIEYHKKKKALATIALAPMEDIENFGVVEIDDDSKITEFKEKPKSHEVKSNLVNTGIYIFEPEVLDMIPQNKFFDFGKELFPALVKKKARIYGYKMVEYWSDVGNLAAYIKANHDAMQGRVRLLIPGKKSSSCVWTGKNSIIHPSAKFEGCVIIGDRCEIKAGAYIKDSVIGNMCVVGSESKIKGSIVWSDSFIYKGTSVLESIIGNWCKVEEGVKIEDNCVISNRSQIRKDTRVPSGTLLKPREVL